MTLKALLGLRPKAETSTAIRDAIAQAETLLTQSTTECERLETARAGLLLGGTEAAVATGEAALAAARAHDERATVMLGALRERLAEAEAREQMAAVAAAHAHAERLSGASAAWFTDEYPRLAEALLRGLEMEAASAAAIDRAMEVIARARNAGADVSGYRAPQQPAERVFAHKPHHVTRWAFGPNIQLVAPDVAPGEAGYIAWPRVQPRIGAGV